MLFYDNLSPEQNNLRLSQDDIAQFVEESAVEAIVEEPIAEEPEETLAQVGEPADEVVDVPQTEIARQTAEAIAVADSTDIHSALNTYVEGASPLLISALQVTSAIVENSVLKDLITGHPPTHWAGLLDALLPSFENLALFSTTISKQRFRELLIIAALFHDTGYYITEDGQFASAGHEDRSIAIFNQWAVDTGLSNVEQAIVRFMIYKTNFIFGDSLAQEVALESATFNAVNQGNPVPADAADFITQAFGLPVTEFNDQRVIMDALVLGRLTAFADIAGNAKTIDEIAGLQPELNLELGKGGQETLLQQVASDFYHGISWPLRLSTMLGQDRIVLNDDVYSIASLDSLVFDDELSRITNSAVPQEVWEDRLVTIQLAADLRNQLETLQAFDATTSVAELQSWRVSTATILRSYVDAENVSPAQATQMQNELLDIYNQSAANFERIRIEIATRDVVTNLTTIERVVLWFDRALVFSTNQGFGLFALFIDRVIVPRFNNISLVSLDEGAGRLVEQAQESGEVNEGTDQTQNTAEESQSATQDQSTQRSIWNVVPTPGTAITNLAIFAGIYYGITLGVAAGSIFVAGLPAILVAGVSAGITYGITRLFGLNNVVGPEQGSVAFTTIDERLSKRPNFYTRTKAIVNFGRNLFTSPTEALTGLARQTIESVQRDIFSAQDILAVRLGIITNRHVADFLNNATADQLKDIALIGPARSQRILENVAEGNIFTGTTLQSALVTQIGVPSANIAQVLENARDVVRASIETTGQVPARFNQLQTISTVDQPNGVIDPTTDQATTNQVTDIPQEVIDFYSIDSNQSAIVEFAYQDGFVDYFELVGNDITRVEYGYVDDFDSRLQVLDSVSVSALDDEDLKIAWQQEITDNLRIYTLLNKTAIIRGVVSFVLSMVQGIPFLSRLAIRYGYVGLDERIVPNFWQVNKRAPVLNSYRDNLLDIYSRNPNLAHAIINSNASLGHGSSSGSLLSVLEIGIRPRNIVISEGNAVVTGEGEQYLRNKYNDDSVSFAYSTIISDVKETFSATTYAYRYAGLQNVTDIRQRISELEQGNVENKLAIIDDLNNLLTTLETEQTSTEQKFNQLLTKYNFPVLYLGSSERDIQINVEYQNEINIVGGIGRENVHIILIPKKLIPVMEFALAEIGKDIPFFLPIEDMTSDGYEAMNLVDLDEDSFIREVKELFTANRQTTNEQAQVEETAPEQTTDQVDQPTTDVSTEDSTNQTTGEASLVNTFIATNRNRIINVSVFAITLGLASVAVNFHPVAKGFPFLPMITASLAVGVNIWRIRRANRPAPAPAPQPSQQATPAEPVSIEDAVDEVVSSPAFGVLSFFTNLADRFRSPADEAVDDQATPTNQDGEGISPEDTTQAAENRTDSSTAGSFFEFNNIIVSPPSVSNTPSTNIGDDDGGNTTTTALAVIGEGPSIRVEMLSILAQVIGGNVIPNNPMFQLLLPVLRNQLQTIGQEITFTPQQLAEFPQLTVLQGLTVDDVDQFERSVGDFLEDDQVPVRQQMQDLQYPPTVYSGQVNADETASRFEITLENGEVIEISEVALNNFIRQFMPDANQEVALYVVKQIAEFFVNPTVGLEAKILALGYQGEVNGEIVVDERPLLALRNPQTNVTSLAESSTDGDGPLTRDEVKEVLQTIFASQPGTVIAADDQTRSLLGPAEIVEEVVNDLGLQRLPNATIVDEEAANLAPAQVTQILTQAVFNNADAINFQIAAALVELQETAPNTLLTELQNQLATDISGAVTTILRQGISAENASVITDSDFINFVRDFTNQRAQIIIAAATTYTAEIERNQAEVQAIINVDGYENVGQLQELIDRLAEDKVSQLVQVMGIEAASLFRQRQVQVAAQEVLREIDVTTITDTETETRGLTGWTRAINIFLNMVRLAVVLTGLWVGVRVAPAPAVETNVAPEPEAAITLQVDDLTQNEIENILDEYPDPALIARNTTETDDEPLEENIDPTEDTVDEVPEVIEPELELSPYEQLEVRLGADLVDAIGRDATTQNQFFSLDDPDFIAAIESKYRELANTLGGEQNVNAVNARLVLAGFELQEVDTNNDGIADTITISYPDESSLPYNDLLPTGFGEVIEVPDAENPYVFSAQQGGTCFMNSHQGAVNRVLANKADGQSVSVILSPIVYAWLFDEELQEYFEENDRLDKRTEYYSEIHGDTPKALQKAVLASMNGYAQKDGLGHYKNLLLQQGVILEDSVLVKNATGFEEQGAETELKLTADNLSPTLKNIFKVNEGKNFSLLLILESFTNRHTFVVEDIVEQNGIEYVQVTEGYSNRDSQNGGLQTWTSQRTGNIVYPGAIDVEGSDSYLIPMDVVYDTMSFANVIRDADGERIDIDVVSEVSTSDSIAQVTIEEVAIGEPNNPNNIAAESLQSSVEAVENYSNYATNRTANSIMQVFVPGSDENSHAVASVRLLLPGLTEAQIQERIQEVLVAFGPELDQYLTDVRNGSWGTTPITFDENGKASLNQVAFLEQFFNQDVDQTINASDTDLHNIGIEEVVQVIAWQPIIDAYNADLLGDIDTEVELVDALANGNLRALGELTQHYAIEQADENWDGNAYLFTVGTSSLNSSSAVQAMNALRIELNKVDGINFSSSDALFNALRDVDKYVSLNAVLESETGLRVEDLLGIERDGNELVTSKTFITEDRVDPDGNIETVIVNPTEETVAVVEEERVVIRDIQREEQGQFDRESTPSVDRSTIGVDSSLNVDGNIDTYVNRLSIVQPDIGGEEEEFFTPLGSGVGYGTYYGDERTVGQANLIWQGLKMRFDIRAGDLTLQEVLQDPLQKRIYDLTQGVSFNDESYLLDQVSTQENVVYQRLNDVIVENQSNLDPQEALDSGEYIGFVATRSPEDIGRRFLIYSSRTPGAEPEFIGVALSVDSAAKVDWIGAINEGQPNELRSVYYEVGGIGERKISAPAWQDSQFVADISKNIFVQLRNGSGQVTDSVKEVKFGVSLVSEDDFLEVVNSRVAEAEPEFERAAEVAEQTQEDQQQIAQLEEIEQIGSVTVTSFANNAINNDLNVTKFKLDASQFVQQSPGQELSSEQFANSVTSRDSQPSVVFNSNFFAVPQTVQETSTSVDLEEITGQVPLGLFGGLDYGKPAGDVSQMSIVAIGDAVALVERPFDSQFFTVISSTDLEIFRIGDVLSRTKISQLDFSVTGARLLGEDERTGQLVEAQGLSRGDGDTNTSLIALGYDNNGNMYVVSGNATITELQEDLTKLGVDSAILLDSGLSVAHTYSVNGRQTDALVAQEDGRTGPAYVAYFGNSEHFTITATDDATDSTPLSTALASNQTAQQEVEEDTRDVVQVTENVITTDDIEIDQPSFGFASLALGTSFIGPTITSTALQVTSQGIIALLLPFVAYVSVAAGVVIAGYFATTMFADYIDRQAAQEERDNLRNDTNNNTWIQRRIRKGIWIERFQVWYDNNIARQEVPEVRTVILGRSGVEGVVGVNGSRTISSRHAEVTIQGASMRITDLNSENGTWVNGQRITEQTLLSVGDIIFLGNPQNRTVRLRVQETGLFQDVGSGSFQPMQGLETLANPRINAQETITDDGSSATATINFGNEVTAIGMDIGNPNKYRNNQDSVSTPGMVGSYTGIENITGVNNQQIKKYGALYIAADGVGSASESEKVSRYFAIEMQRAYYDDTLGSFNTTEERIEAAYERVRQQLNQDKLDLAIGDAKAAAALFVVTEQELVVANVGDSRVSMYDRHSDDFITLTKDQTLAQEESEQNGGRLVDQQSRSKATIKGSFNPEAQPLITTSIPLNSLSGTPENLLLFAHSDGFNDALAKNSRQGSRTARRDNQTVRQVIAANDTGSMSDVVKALVEAVKQAPVDNLGIVGVNLGAVVSQLAKPLPTIGIRVNGVRDAITVQRRQAPTQAPAPQPVTPTVILRGEPISTTNGTVVAEQTPNNSYLADGYEINVVNNQVSIVATNEQLAAGRSVVIEGRELTSRSTGLDAPVLVSLLNEETGQLLEEIIITSRDENDQAIFSHRLSLSTDGTRYVIETIDAQNSTQLFQTEFFELDEFTQQAATGELLEVTPAEDNIIGGNGYSVIVQDGKLILFTEDFLEENGVFVTSGGPNRYAIPNVGFDLTTEDRVVRVVSGGSIEYTFELSPDGTQYIVKTTRTDGADVLNPVQSLEINQTNTLSNESLDASQADYRDEECSSCILKGAETNGSLAEAEDITDTAEYLNETDQIIADLLASLNSGVLADKNAALLTSLIAEVELVQARRAGTAEEIAEAVAALERAIQEINTALTDHGMTVEEGSVEYEALLNKLQADLVSLQAGLSTTDDVVNENQGLLQTIVSFVRNLLSFIPFVNTTQQVDPFADSNNYPQTIEGDGYVDELLDTEATDSVNYVRNYEDGTKTFIKIATRRAGQASLQREIAALQYLQEADPSTVVTKIVSTNPAGFENTSAIALEMELAELETYDSDELRDSFTDAEKKIILTALLEEVKKVHALGVQHGDLKLNNITISRTGSNSFVVNLFDFGRSGLNYAAETFLTDIRILIESSGSYDIPKLLEIVLDAQGIPTSQYNLNQDQFDSLEEAYQAIELAINDVDSFINQTIDRTGTGLVIPDDSGVDAGDQSNEFSNIEANNSIFTGQVFVRAQDGVVFVNSLESGTVLVGRIGDRYIQDTVLEVYSGQQLELQNGTVVTVNPDGVISVVNEAQGISNTIESDITPQIGESEQLATAESFDSFEDFIDSFSTLVPQEGINFDVAQQQQTSPVISAVNGLNRAITSVQSFGRSIVEIPVVARAIGIYDTAVNTPLGRILVPAVFSVVIVGAILSTMSTSPAFAAVLVFLSTSGIYYNATDAGIVVFDQLGIVPDGFLNTQDGEVNELIDSVDDADNAIQTILNNYEGRETQDMWDDFIAQGRARQQRQSQGQNTVLERALLNYASVREAIRSGEYVMDSNLTVTENELLAAEQIGVSIDHEQIMRGYLLVDGEDRLDRNIAFAKRLSQRFLEQYARVRNGQSAVPGTDLTNPNLDLEVYRAFEQRARLTGIDLENVDQTQIDLLSASMLASLRVVQQTFGSLDNYRAINIRIKSELESTIEEFAGFDNFTFEETTLLLPISGSDFFNSNVRSPIYAIGESQTGTFLSESALRAFNQRALPLYKVFIAHELTHTKQSANKQELEQFTWVEGYTEGFASLMTQTARPIFYREYASRFRQARNILLSSSIYSEEEINRAFANTGLTGFAYLNEFVDVELGDQMLGDIFDDVFGQGSFHLYMENGFTEDIDVVGSITNSTAYLIQLQKLNQFTSLTTQDERQAWLTESIALIDENIPVEQANQLIEGFEALVFPDFSAFGQAATELANAITTASQSNYLPDGCSDCDVFVPQQFQKAREIDSNQTPIEIVRQLQVIIDEVRRELAQQLQGGQEKNRVLLLALIASLETMQYRIDPTEKERLDAERTIREALRVGEEEQDAIAQAQASGPYSQMFAELEQQLEIIVTAVGEVVDGLRLRSFNQNNESLQTISQTLLEYNSFVNNLGRGLVIPSQQSNVTLDANGQIILDSIPDEVARTFANPREEAVAQITKVEQKAQLAGIIKKLSDQLIQNLPNETNGLTPLTQEEKDILEADVLVTLQSLPLLTQIGLVDAKTIETQVRYILGGVDAGSDNNGSNQKIISMWQKVRDAQKTVAPVTVEEREYAELTQLLTEIKTINLAYNQFNNPTLTNTTRAATPQAPQIDFIGNRNLSILRVGPNKAQEIISSLRDQLQATRAINNFGQCNTECVYFYYNLVSQIEDLANEVETLKDNVENRSDNLPTNMSADLAQLRRYLDEDMARLLTPLTRFLANTPQLTVEELLEYQDVYIQLKLITNTPIQDSARQQIDWNLGLTMQERMQITADLEEVDMVVQANNIPRDVRLLRALANKYKAESKSVVLSDINQLDTIFSQLQEGLGQPNVINNIQVQTIITAYISRGIVAAQGALASALRDNVGTITARAIEENTRFAEAAGYTVDQDKGRQYYRSGGLTRLETRRSFSSNDEQNKQRRNELGQIYKDLFAVNLGTDNAGSLFHHIASNRSFLFRPKVAISLNFNSNNINPDSNVREILRLVSRTNTALVTEIITDYERLYSNSTYNVEEAGTVKHFEQFWNTHIAIGDGTAITNPEERLLNFAKDFVPGITEDNARDLAPSILYDIEQLYPDEVAEIAINTTFTENELTQEDHDRMKELVNAGIPLSSEDTSKGLLRLLDGLKTTKGNIIYLLFSQRVLSSTAHVRPFNRPGTLANVGRTIGGVFVTGLRTIGWVITVGNLSISGVDKIAATGTTFQNSPLYHYFNTAASSIQKVVNDFQVLQKLNLRKDRIFKSFRLTKSFVLSSNPDTRLNQQRSMAAVTAVAAMRHMVFNNQTYNNQPYITHGLNVDINTQADERAYVPFSIIFGSSSTPKIVRLSMNDNETNFSQGSMDLYVRLSSFRAGARNRVVKIRLDANDIYDPDMTELKMSNKINFLINQEVEAGIFIEASEYTSRGITIIDEGDQDEITINREPLTFLVKQVSPTGTTYNPITFTWNELVTNTVADLLASANQQLSDANTIDEVRWSSEDRYIIADNTIYTDETIAPTVLDLNEYWTRDTSYVSNIGFSWTYDPISGQWNLRPHAGHMNGDLAFLNSLEDAVTSALSAEAEFASLTNKWMIDNNETQAFLYSRQLIEGIHSSGADRLEQGSVTATGVVVSGPSILNYQNYLAIYARLINRLVDEEYLTKEEGASIIATYTIPDADGLDNDTNRISAMALDVQEIIEGGVPAIRQRTTEAKQGENRYKYMATFILSRLVGRDDLLKYEQGLVNGVAWLLGFTGTNTLQLHSLGRGPVFTYFDIGNKEGKVVSTVRSQILPSRNGINMEVNGARGIDGNRTITLEFHPASIDGLIDPKWQTAALDIKEILETEIKREYEEHVKIFTYEGKEILVHSGGDNSSFVTLYGPEDEEISFAIRSNGGQETTELLTLRGKEAVNLERGQWIRFIEDARIYRIGTKDSGYIDANGQRAVEVNFAGNFSTPDQYTCSSCAIGEAAVASAVENDQPDVAQEYANDHVRANRPFQTYASSLAAMLAADTQAKAYIALFQSWWGIQRNNVARFFQSIAAWEQGDETPLVVAGYQDRIATLQTERAALQENLNNLPASTVTEYVSAAAAVVRNVLQRQATRFVANDRSVELQQALFIQEAEFGEDYEARSEGFRGLRLTTAFVAGLARLTTASIVSFYQTTAQNILNASASDVLSYSARIAGPVLVIAGILIASELLQGQSLSDITLTSLWQSGSGVGFMSIFSRFNIFRNNDIQENGSNSEPANPEPPTQGDPEEPGVGKEVVEEEIPSNEKTLTVNYLPKGQDFPSRDLITITSEQREEGLIITPPEGHTLLRYRYDSDTNEFVRSNDAENREGDILVLQRLENNEIIRTKYGFGLVPGGPLVVRVTNNEVAQVRPFQYDAQNLTERTINAGVATKVPLIYPIAVDGADTRYFAFNETDGLENDLVGIDVNKINGAFTERMATFSREEVNNLRSVGRKFLLTKTPSGEQYVPVDSDYSIIPTFNRDLEIKFENTTSSVAITQNKNTIGEATVTPGQTQVITTGQNVEALLTWQLNITTNELEPVLTVVNASVHGQNIRQSSGNHCYRYCHSLSGKLAVSISR